MQHRLFGGLTVLRDGRPVDLGGRKQRTVLAALLLEAGRAVPPHRLIDRVWGEAPPPRAESSLQAYVSHLRRALEPDRRRGARPETLVTDPGGYRMAVAPDDLDVTRFEALCASGAAALAAGDASAAVEALDRALALWGPLLPELAHEPWVVEAATRLDSLRAGATEQAAEARLALGRHREVIPDLEAAVADYPYRERLRAHLALALYRDGRQTDALRSLADARRQLADDIGVEPGPELAALEADVLAHAPHLLAPASHLPAPPAATPTVAAPPVAAAPAAAAPPAAGAGPMGFVGRERELAELVEVARAAAAGNGCPVVVSGEPGIGKTRLVEELVARQAGGADVPGGTVVVWARCAESAASAPFWVMGQIKEQLLAAGVLADDAIARFRAAEASLGADDPAVARLAVNRSAVEALRSSSRSLLIVVDDLQWADPSSMRSLEFIAAELRTMPLLLVATVRPLAPEPSPRLVDCLGELARQAGARRIELTGLSEPEVAAWVRARNEANVPDTVSHLVHERTAGNPFFVGEVVELLARRHRLDDVDGARDRDVPAAVHDVVRRRVGLLPPATREVLATASVLGDAIDLDLLARVAGRPVDEVLDALDPAVAAAMLVEDPAAPGRLRFAHSLVADALAAELTLSRRARLHAAATEALESLRNADLDRYLPELVHHARAGAMAGTAPQAFAYAVRAARLAAAQIAHEDSAAYWDAALAVLDQAHPGDRRARLDVLVELGIARRRADEMDGSQAVLLEAIGIAEALDDSVAARRAAASLPAVAVWQSFQYGTVNRPLVAALERVLARMGDEISAERADILGALADALHYDDDPGRSERASAEAVVVARAVGDPAVLSRALGKRTQALTRSVHLPERRAVADEMVAIAEHEALPDDLACVAHFLRAAAAFECGERKVFEADLARAKVLAGRSGEPGLRSQLGWFETSWLLERGRYDEAESCAHEAHQLHRRTRGWAADDILVANLAAIAHDRGRLDDVIAQVDGFIDSDFGPAMRELVGWMLTEGGRPDEARSLVGPAGVAPDPPDDWLWPAAITAAAYVRAALHDTKACAGLYERMTPCAGRIALAGAGGPPLGAIDLALARLAGALGDDDSARWHAAEAVDLLDRFGARPWLARALVTQADLLARSDDPDDRARAEPAADRARTLAADLGLVPVLRAVTELDFGG